MGKRFLVGVILVLVLLVGYVTYYGLGLKKRLDSSQAGYAKLAKECVATIGQEKKVENCLRNVEAGYLIRWESNCKKLGRGKSCLLPEGLATHYDEVLRNERDFCLRLYGQ